MKREDAVAICSKCIYRLKDKEHGILCQYTNEYADFEDKCDKFDPADDYLEKKRVSAIALRDKINEIGYRHPILILIFSLVLNITFIQDYWSGFFRVLFYVIIFVAIALDYYYFFIYKPNRLKGDITKRGLKKIIHKVGFYPKENKDGDISFRVGDFVYNVDYNKHRFDMYLTFGSECDIDISTKAAIRVTEKMPIVKVTVGNSPSEQGQFTIVFVITTWIKNIDELETFFEDYYKLIGIASELFDRTYISIENEIIERYAQSDKKEN